jgi:voltage-gated potassium channel
MRLKAGEKMKRKKSNNQSTDTSHRVELLHRIERITELPFLVLAFAMIPLLIGPLVWDMSPKEENTFLIIDYFIWALFAVDLLVKILISPHRLNYLKRHWLEVLIVIVPFFRPLRIFGYSSSGHGPG